MSDSVDRFLAPGEETLVELAPSGWPRLTLLPAFAYAVLVLGLLVAIADGRELDLTLASLPVNVPILVPAIIVLAALELYRVARYRSSLYAVTSARVLVVRGVLWRRLVRAAPVATVRRVYLVGSDPEVVLSGGAWILEGAGPSGLAALEKALPSAKSVEAEPLTPPAPPSRRREGAFLAVVVALVVLVQARAVARARSLLEAQGFMTAILSAVGRAEASTKTDLATAGVRVAGGGSGHAINVHGGVWDVILHSYNGGGTYAGGVEVEVKGEWSAGWVFRKPDVLDVRFRSPLPGNDVFVKNLRHEAEALGVAVRVKPQ